MAAVQKAVQQPLETLWKAPAAGRADTVALLTRVLDTVLKQPAEAKFRSVSIEKTKSRLSAVAGAVAFLEAAGWSTTTTHYELSPSADLELLRACLNALNEYAAAHPDPKPTAAAPVAVAPAPAAKKVVNKAFKAETSKSDEDDETAKAIAEIERKKKERKAMEEMRRKEKASDYKPVCASTAKELKFGSTKGVLPPPKKSA